MKKRDKNYKCIVILLSIAAYFVISSGCSNVLNKNNIHFDPKTIKVGKGAGSVEVADFNGDSFPDVAVANAEDSSITILLNDGKGNFKEANGSPVFANCFPNDIAIADVNNDGYVDLAIANTEVSFLTILAGNGKGEFHEVPQSPYYVHSRPHTHGIAVADFNGDGNLDLATDDWAENKIIIIYGDGKFNFNNESSYTVGNRPYQRLRAADINKDGKPEIVTTNLEGNNTTVLLNEGGKKFTESNGSPFPSGIAPFGIAIGDVNGDGNQDLAIVNSPTITAKTKGNDGLWILTGNGKGNFYTLKGSPFKTGKSPGRVAIGDLNGDGINDIAVTNYNDKSISIFYMNKNSVASNEVINVGNRPDGITIHDLNGDGKKDIIESNYDDGTVIILFNR